MEANWNWSITWLTVPTSTWCRCASVAPTPVWSGIHIYSVCAWSSVVPRMAAFWPRIFSSPGARLWWAAGFMRFLIKTSRLWMSMRGFLISTRSRQCRYSASGTSLRDGKFCIILKQSFTPCPPATPWVFPPAAICRSARAGMMTFISASFRCAKLWLTAARSRTRSKGNTFVWKKRQKQKIGKRKATFYRFVSFFAKQIWKN